VKTVNAPTPVQLPEHWFLRFLPWLAGALQLILLWGTALPLGVPDEWVWERMEPGPEFLSGLLLAGPVGIIYLVYVHRGANVLPELSPRWRWFWLLGLYLLGGLWFWTAWLCLPGVQGPSRGPIVLYLHQTEGYFAQSLDVEHPAEFLQTYPARIADSSLPENYLHLGTHPPGLTLGYWCLRELVQRNSWLEWLGTSTQPAEVREAIQIIRGVPPGFRRPADEAALWLAVLLTVSWMLATVFPLYGLGTLLEKPQAGWLAAACWPLVPALLVFTPKSDVLYPPLAVAAQYCWLRGWCRGGAVWGALTGLLMFAGVWLSLAFVPIGVAFVVQAALAARGEAAYSPASALTADSLPEPAQSRRQRVLQTVLAGGGMFGLLVLGCWLWGVNLPLIWWRNYLNHAAFYSHATRTYSRWLWVNPFEVTGAVGAPVICLFVWGCWQQRAAGLTVVRRWLEHGGAVLLIWMLLWLSGKNMGEAARLWVVFFPFLLWSTAIMWPDRCAYSAYGLAAQMLTCLGTGVRVKGLDFGG
jgi:hypothetical protein